MSRATRALLALWVVLVGLDVVAHLPPPAPQELDWPDFEDEDVAAIRVTRDTRSYRLDRAGDGWVLDDGRPARPLDPLVRALVERGGLLSEVESGELFAYGLGTDNRVVVELIGEDRTLLTLWIGDNNGPGTSFVTLGDDVVYRARVGGRGIWDRAPDVWVRDDPHEEEIVEKDPDSGE